MLRLILKNMQKKKMQTVAILFSLVISVAVLFALLLVHSGISKGIALSEERLGADLVVIPTAAEQNVENDDLLFAGSSALYYMDSAIADDIRAVSGVKRISPQFFCQTLVASTCCTDGLKARIVGFDPETDWAIRPWMTTQLSGDLADNEIVAGCEIAGVDDEGVLRVLGKDFQVVSRLEKTGTSLDYSLMLDIDTARQLARDKEEYAYLWRENGDPAHLVTAFLVELEPDADVDKVATLVGFKTDTAVIKSAQAIEEVQGQTNAVLSLMLGAAILLALASILQLFARFYTMTWDRRMEFGLYRALGAKKKTLRFLVFGEMLLLIIAGSILGLALGFGLYRGVLSTISATSSFPFVSPLGTDMLIFGLAVLLCMLLIGFLATAAPIKLLNKISPTLAMQRGNID